MFQKIIAPASSLINTTLTHPFYAQLLQRQLPEASLRHYLSQDMIYLEKLGVLLPKLSARLNSPEDKAIFDQLTPNTVQAEQKNRGLFNTEKPGVISPVISAYLTHLENYAQHPDLAVAIAAHLACPWFYKKAAELINPADLENKSCHQTHLVKSYTCPNFQRATDQAIEIMLKQIDPTDEETVVANMSKAFMLSLKYEWAFGEECFNALLPTAFTTGSHSLQRAGRHSTHKA